MKRLRLAFVILGLLSLPSLDARGQFCPEQPDVLCGHRCSSNSCVQDSFSDPDFGCWLDFTTVPVTCDGDYLDCCESGPGL